ncbi:MAG TPA: M48 family metalloprotease [Acidimicrobiia bacterium]|nr:M48 family metalloprotease [Acidimicrobiia bacterium]
MAEPISPPDRRTELHHAVRANQRRTVAALAAAAGVLLVVGVVVVLLAGLGLVGVLAVVVVAAAVAAVVHRSAGRVVLAAAGARPAEGRDALRLHNLTEGLCIADGLAKPALYVVDDDALNAFTAGSSPRRAALVVTTGLLGSLNRVELEGVLAHELSHIKNHDTMSASVAVVALAGPVLLADAGRRPGASVLARPAVVLGVLAPLAAWALRRAMDPRRELDADTAGVRLTRYPPGLASALAKLRDDGTTVRRATRATTSLWLADPVDHPAPFEAHPPLDERIRTLEVL